MNWMSGRSIGKKRRDKVSNNFLIFCRASNHSLHKEWLVPKEDINFDLFLEYYGEKKEHFREDCDYYSYHPEGTKFIRLYELIRDNKINVFDYDAIWIVDDDISTDSTTINRMFKIFNRYKLSIAQPALTEESYISHSITKVVPNNILRYTNMVEGMAPIISNKALKLCWETFQKSKSGWGLGWIWQKVLGNPTDEIAIIDSTPVTHTRKEVLETYTKVSM